ncbi:hypothetical protein ACTOB_002890 [Actinoplanes oblitus]|uniref:Uncharacterized protein n=1 Tax=Actinoplanes oblitus TaxID=3040509 RepID=A0ABY8WQ89_9ACTN|nr:hypothetical protein [Actinoplanes oblitus]WIM99243.1 hypothetical protein ACTOB_002890 [Actinoplanes oblitus]
MRETPEQLAEPQRLLAISLSGSTAHLRSIVTERTLTAERVTPVLTGMCALSPAAVTARGEPRISAVDGHDRWIFGTARTAAKAPACGTCAAMICASSCTAVRRPPT